MVMFDMSEMPKGRNLGSDIIDKLNVSTALYYTWIDGCGGWVKVYETILFHFNPETRERGGVAEMYGHALESDAIDFHARICKILTYLQERKERKNGK